MEHESKENILRKARQESKKGYDEYEIATFSKAFSIASVVGITLTLSVMLLEWIFLKTVNTNNLMILSGFISTMDFIRFKQLGKPKDLIEGCAMSLIFLCTLIFFVFTLINGGK